MTEKEREVQPYDNYRTYLEGGFIESEIPNYISDNIKYDLRYYQKEACSFFDYYMDEEKNTAKPDHLMYHMATGSGKTVVMGCNIIELYKRGYRNFVFFVDKSNIVEKTKSNFLDKGSSKYIFTDSIHIDGKNVSIEEVDNFEMSSSDDIKIKFSTIQGLHEELNNPRENSTTYQDLNDKNLVLISDEAHHINASTKSEEEKKNTWEDTVDRIMEKNNKNILLEFTATAGLDNDNVYEKYRDKIIYQYSLKQFRKDRFSKEVKVLESDTDSIDRAINAVILSQYRRKVAVNNGLPNFKPVLMLKSRTIDNSENNQEKFNDAIKSLDEEKLLDMKRDSAGVVREAFDYFASQDIKLENLAREIQREFAEDRTISVNSAKDDTARRRVLLNSLEDDDNNIRVIFAVDKLNEGWDVLNLFDIVRMFDKSSSGSGPLKTTIQEAQLIGRGARYRPFKIEENQERFKRKYDDDTDNELRVLEELYYHSKHNPDYIENLKTSLVNSGIMASDTKEVELEVKQEFKNSKFWNKKLFVNKKKKKTKKDLKNISSVAQNIRFKYEVSAGSMNEITILEDQNEDSYNGEKRTAKFSLSELPDNVLRVAIQSSRFYKYSNIRNYFTEIDSTFDLINSEGFLDCVTVELIGSQLVSMNQEQKLELAESVLSRLESKIRSSVANYEGTKKFYSKEISEVVKDKKRNIHIDKDESDAERGVSMSEQGGKVTMDLSKKDWYVYNDNYGTSQEKYLIRFIDNAMEEIQDKYESVYLIRNASLFKIHRFKDGKSIEPDFVLLVYAVDSSKMYQLFVEPKGEGFLEHDSWKEEFLESIRDNYTLENLYSNEEVRLVGMPFYNEDIKHIFEEELEEVLDIEKLF